jgi:hypothetical protein
MISVVDDQIKSGAPGSASTSGRGHNTDHGVTHFEVHTYD